MNKAHFASKSREPRLTDELIFRWIKRLLKCVAGLGLLLVAFWIGRSYGAMGAVQRTIAMSWGDGMYGPGFYGAWVYVKPSSQSGKVDVYAKVFIGGPDVSPGAGIMTYFDDIGLLGTENDERDAAAKWGAVEWKPEGVWFGAGTPQAKLIPRSRVQNHR